MWNVVMFVVALCSVAHAKDSADVAAIKKLIAAEAAALMEGGDHTDPKVFTRSATVSTPGSGIERNDSGIRNILSGYVVELKPYGIQVGLARDGKSAWVTFEASTQTACDSCEAEAGPRVRSSQLVVKVGNAWLVESALWSVGVPDATANKAAKQGKQDVPEKLADADTGDAKVRAAFATLVTKGFDAAAASVKGVGVGSAPNELVGFKHLVPYYNKAWVGKLAVGGPVWATVAPSGTTAVVMANVELTKTEGKTTYKMPFRWFVVFDKDAAGAWQPVHVHFAVT